MMDKKNSQMSQSMQKNVHTIKAKTRNKSQLAHTTKKGSIIETDHKTWSIIDTEGRETPG